jgi:CheY-like chemotaxis protein
MMLRCGGSARGLMLDGYEVVEAVDGQDALAQLGHRLPDVVVTDLAMPRLDGIRLVQALAANPVYAQIPVLVMTGNASISMPPGYPLLRKPFPLRDLIDAVRRLVP